MIGVVWGGFLVLFLALLVFDLSVLHREAKELSVRQALTGTGIWICIALSFTAVIYGLYEYQWLGFRPGPNVDDGEDKVRRNGDAVVRERIDG